MTWDSERIASRLLPLSQAMGRMPSVSELQRQGEGDLANAIARGGGFAYWSRQIGAPLKDSSTKTGQAWELFVLGFLLGKGVEVARQTTKAKFDLLVNGVERVNVKSAHYNAYGSSKGHFFGIGKTHENCDWFALVRISENPKPILWVPSQEAKQQTISLTETHRFNSFTDFPWLTK